MQAKPQLWHSRPSCGFFCFADFLFRTPANYANHWFTEKCVFLKKFHKLLFFKGLPKPKKGLM